MILEDLPQDQQQVVIAIISSKSLVEASKASKISLTKIYSLLKDETFKQVLDAERNRLFRESLECIKCHTTKAVNVLASLLDSDDERIKRAAANDIIDKAFKSQEIMQIEERINLVEAKLCELG